MEGRRERKKRQTHEAIAEVAVRLFAERGFDEVTIADVAAAADVSASTVFNHFKTKEDLFFGAFTPPEDALAARLRERPPGTGPAAVVEAFLLEAVAPAAEPDARSEREAHHSRFRSVLLASPALQVHAAHLYRARRMESLGEVAAALAAPDEPDAFAYLVAGQLLALVDGAFCEGERRRRAGEAPEAIGAALREAVARACAALGRGLAGYGVAGRPR